MATLILSVGLFVLLVWLTVERRRRRTQPVIGGAQTDQHIDNAHPLTLYANPFSHCSRKVALAAAEYQLNFVYQPIDLIETGSYETISAAYLKINPSGLLPTLLHEHVPVYESDDILTYMEDLSLNLSLYPDDDAGHTEMEKWIAFCSLSSADPMADQEAKAGACVPALTMPIFATMVSEVPFRRILLGLLFHPDKKRPVFFAVAKLLGLRGIMKLIPLREFVRAGRDNMQRHLMTLETALAATPGPWMLNAEFTMADITIGVVYYRLDETGWLDYFQNQTPMPALSRHYENLRARPSWKVALEDRQLDIITRGSERLKFAVENDAGVRAALYG